MPSRLGGRGPPPDRMSARTPFLFSILLALAAVALPTRAQTSQGVPVVDPAAATSGAGPIRLRQPAAPVPQGAGSAAASAPAAGRNGRAFVEPPKPSEFEAFVQRLAGPDQPVRRFGTELLAGAEPEPAEVAPLVPPDYLVKPGDELLVTFWGSVDADMRLIVDRNGRITIPRVGPVAVAGLRYADLPATITQRASQVFRNFQVSVSMTQLRGHRVFVTGFVARPGTYTVSSLATIAQVLLEAGGPSAAGSLRNIELRRANRRESTLDLYDVLLRGDRSADRIVQGDDVIHVGPVGTQVGLIGSINRPAVFELRNGETLADLLSMGGGLNAVADTSRVGVERLDERATVRIVQLPLPASLQAKLSQGDVVRAFSSVDTVASMQRQNKRIRIEGEVARPGEYVLPPTSTVSDALAAAGGLTPAAFPFGTEFTRESVRATQQQNYDRALRDLETDLARSNTAQRPEDAATQGAREASNNRLLATLRAMRPTGRIVLQLEPESRELPALLLEDGDRLFVPPRPTSVGVFGSVYNGGSYLYSSGRTLDEYLRLAGGPTRGADEASTFVIRANGSVVSNQQRSRWLRSTVLPEVRAEPGDTVFVPEELDKTTFVQAAKDWTQILYQFGLGVAGIVAASR